MNVSSMPQPPPAPLNFFFFFLQLFNFGLCWIEATIFCSMCIRLCYPVRWFKVHLRSYTWIVTWLVKPLKPHHVIGSIWLSGLPFRQFWTHNLALYYSQETVLVPLCCLHLSLVPMYYNLHSNFVMFSFGICLIVL